ncbi:hypothetical protein KsCSTR_36850 [Candidatus Kuenenia stuttgartiensis]|uniref:Uncharacterized protein n=1 Tax=Kuenenia stuttgartiensis TaxID=174633 RepID=Q1Q6E2_KUEST|nr:hypothetical protein KsCSTR_36850 [Candidatus Kuenenia stuttgartiensis]CAJ73134.1 unknown protein [Candidatus Kuenenia stuttgartiensis]
MILLILYYIIPFILLNNPFLSIYSLPSQNGQSKSIPLQEVCTFFLTYIYLIT